MKAQNNPAFFSLKFILVDLIGDILYWPVWWYSKGLMKFGRFCLNEVIAQEERLGVSIWLKNIFVPMFAQYDWEGRLISFFMRLIQIIIRLIIWSIWALLILIIFIIWLILPLVITYQIVINFLALFS